MGDHDHDIDPAPWWTYRARPDPYSDHDRGVVDGDTLDVQLDQGLDSYGSTRVRLAGVDTAETYGVSHDTAEFRAGAEQTAFVDRWVGHAVREWSGTWPLVVRTERDTSGKYGRLLADIRRRVDDAGLAAALVDRYPSVDISSE
jgi:endonuclease YncB( thermonuclease family)